MKPMKLQKFNIRFASDRLPPRKRQMPPLKGIP